jgi:hypothetical protein
MINTDCMKSPSQVGRDIIAAVKIRAVLIGIVLMLGACDGSNPSAPTSEKAATPAPNEEAALDVVRKTAEAQSIFFKLHRRYAQTFDELVQARLLDNEPSTAQTGYDFKLRPSPDAQTYKLEVAPTTPATARYFFVDESGAIRSESGKSASSGSPELK